MNFVSFLNLTLYFFFFIWYFGEIDGRKDFDKISKKEKSFERFKESKLF
jgi:hypothetical protein